ncbi:MAG: hypothetical protein OXC44_07580 [Proteobacteria bacterium]|nr:hypothetical protein [Pseudomonadota bacterium]
MFSRTMSKEDVRHIARNIIAFRDRIAPLDLYSDSIINHLYCWFLEALIRRALLLSPKCRIKCIQMRNELNESIIHSFSKGVLKKLVLDSRLFVKYKEPGKKERGEC